MVLIDLYLVDDEEHPLHRCLVEAVIRHEPRIRRKFDRYSDHGVKHGDKGKARRVAARERRNRNKAQHGMPTK